MSSRDTLRRTFDRAADLYLRARPRYPDALYADLISTTGLPEHAALLEVGCGPGLATEPLARRGYHIDCIEPGPALASAAVEHLRSYPNVSVFEGDFETVTNPRPPYAMIYAATAWQWTHPDSRYARAASLLSPRGYLAFWDAMHVFPEGGDPIFRDLQPVYDEIGEGMPPGAVWPTPDSMPDRADEIGSSRCFELVKAKSYDWEVQYTAEGYIDLLRTFSGHINMPEWKRDRLFAAVRSYCNQRKGLPIRRHWGCVLHIARKTD